jgi:DNA-binding NtrC family response regulator
MLEAATILLADDDPHVRKVLGAYLERIGFLVLSAANGEEALGIARSFEGVIQVLISDVTMPGMLGTQLARELTRNRPEVKVLLVSATGVLPEEIDPGWAFLAKPFSPDLLLDRLLTLAGTDPRLRRQSAPT